MNLESVLSLLGGLALFLYGMQMMSSGLESAAGNRMKRILERLVKERYIDEARYARFYINDKFRFNKWGRNKIIQGLRAKKIPASVYAVELEGIDEEDYLDILRSLLEAKRRDVKARNSYERDCKLIRFALGRGYEMEAIRRCLSVSDEFMD